MKLKPFEEYPLSVVREARRLRREGRTNAEISEALGITDYTVRNWIGKQPGQPQYIVHDHQMHDRAMYLRECGYSIREIADQINVPRATVGDWVRGMGCYGRTTD